VAGRENKSTEGRLRDEKGRLLPGVSGNPGGRPKLVAEFQKALREQHYERALAALLDCLDDSDGRVRIAAVREVFDRLFGKPKQPITGEEGAPPVSVDLASLLERLAGQ
jgi:hypothetical protein